MTTGPLVTTAAVIGPEHRPAGIVTRLSAAIVDAIVVLVVGLLIHLTFAGARFIYSPTTFQWDAVSLWASLTLEIIVAIIYLTSAWAVIGRSYGDTLLGLRVLSRRRRRPGWALALLRATFCVLFPVGLFWVVISPDRRSIQDAILRTVVVYDWRAESPS